MTDEELAALSIVERNEYLDRWTEQVRDPVWVIEDDEEEERRLYSEWQEELSRSRWSY